MTVTDFHTVDAIVAHVEASLRTPAAVQRLAKIDSAVERVLGQREQLAAWHKHLQEREGVRFYVNFTKAQAGDSLLSVRTSGVQCGIVELADPPLFSVPASGISSKLRALWPVDDAVEWRHKRVAAYIKSAVVTGRKSFANRESAVEAELIELMRWRGQPKGRKHVLRGYQPVLYCNLPLQLPSPITPRGKKKGMTGHIDVLARTRPGRLEVFEVKSPTAADSSHALHQAVAYAAALRAMMDRDSQRKNYWELFESERSEQHMATIGATALVHEKYKKQLKTAIECLQETNSAKIGLKVMLYRWEPRGVTRTLHLDEKPW